MRHDLVGQNPLVMPVVRRYFLVWGEAKLMLTAAGDHSAGWPPSEATGEAGGTLEEEVST